MPPSFHGGRAAEEVPGLRRGRGLGQSARRSAGVRAGAGCGAAALPPAGPPPVATEARGRRGCGLAPRGGPGGASARPSPTCAREEGGSRRLAPRSPGRGPGPRLPGAEPSAAGLPWPLLPQVKEEGCPLPPPLK